MPKQTVPELRLEGFSGEWDGSTIGSQAEIVMGQSPHGSSYNTKSAGEVLVQGNADLVDGWVTPRIWTTEPTRIAEPGTLIMSVRAPVGAVGKTRHRVVLGRGVAGIRGNEFIFQYLTKLEQDGYWSSKSSGSTFDSVNGTEIRATQISIPPTLEEQQAIGAIFTNLDAAINQHTLKYKALQQAKTALMQRMFPQEGQTVPELRLEGFDGEWETTSIGTVSALHNGRDYKHLGEGCIPVYGTGGYMVSVDQALSHDEDAVGIGRKGTINKPYILKAPFWTVDTLFYLVPNQDTELAFFYASVLQIDWMAKNTATGLPSLTSPAISSADISVPPTLEEQKAIGAVFTQLDTLIAAEAQYIVSLKQAKTALLQRMFI